VYSLSQKLLAEWIGTFAVVFIAAGSICADQYLRSSGQGSRGLLENALAYGLAVAIMVSAIGRVSGGHLNPAVTVGLWVTKRFGTVQTVIQAAVDRGELPARTPPDLIIDAIMGRVISLIVLTPGARRATINAEREGYAASITDFVLDAIAGLAWDP